MKSIIPPYILALPIVMTLAGCGKEPQPVTPPPQAKVEEKSTAQTAIEGFTGKTAVDAGTRARDQIKVINEKKNQDMEGL